MRSERLHIGALATPRRARSTTTTTARRPKRVPSTHVRLLATLRTSVGQQPSNARRGGRTGLPSTSTKTRTTLTNIGVVMFTVADQDAALAFHTEKLGNVVVVIERPQDATVGGVTS